MSLHIRTIKTSKATKIMKELWAIKKNLYLKTMKKEKPGGRYKKINSREKSFLYLIAFSFTTNRYLCSNFEDLLIKSIFLFIF